ncbi:MAG: shikimate kinase [Bacteroidales bacterium]|nr:shikimate kinase [Bacteroidales bacterium]
MKYYIVGYMYSGKSTFGRRVAIEKDLDFLDLDDAFERRYHFTITDFFARFGEKAFRQLEEKILLSTEKMDNIVVSTGGGTPCFGSNMDFMLHHGTVIYLRMNADEICARAETSHRQRPLLQHLSDSQRRTFVEQQLSQRETFYSRSHIILDGNNPTLPNLD